MGDKARLVLRKDKKNKKGLCPISVCITHKGVRTFSTTGISVSEKDWDAAKKIVKSSHPNALPYNIRLSTRLTESNRDILSAEDRGNLTLKTVKAITKPSVDFFQYCEKVLAEMEKLGQTVTAKRYRNNLPSIREFAGNTFSLSSIDRDWLKGYEEFCRGARNPRQKKDAKPISQNTIWSRFKMLRKILLHASEAGVIQHCPIGKSRGGYPMPVFEQVPKDYLTQREVDKLFHKLGHAGLSAHEDMVLSFFLIECTAGIRHSDWSRFEIEKLIDGESLKVRAKKTGEPVYVPIGKGTILAQVLAHIQERGYVYTLTESAAANKTLKHLADFAGIKKRITTHTGRHTAATLYLGYKLSRETVAEILGISIKVVDTYAKMTRQKVQFEFDGIGGGIFPSTPNPDDSTVQILAENQETA